MSQLANSWRIELGLISATLIASVIAYFVRQFSASVVIRSLKAVILGACIGFICVFFGYFPMGMALVMMLPRAWILPVGTGLTFTPWAFAIWVMSRYSAARFIRRAFLAGMFLGTLLTLWLCLNS